jgi:hypothetical protein
MNRLLTSSRGLTLEILQTSQLFSPNPLVISLQFTEKIHNWVKYGQWVLVDAPTPPPIVIPPPPIVPPFLVAPLPLAFSLPLAKLMPRVIVPPLGATIPLMINHNWEIDIVATF